MALQEIKDAVEAGKIVCWKNNSYVVKKDNLGQWLICHYNGYCIGLTWNDDTTMNGAESDFYIEQDLP
jgi:hypothetical protein